MCIIYIKINTSIPVCTYNFNLFNNYSFFVMFLLIKNVLNFFYKKLLINDILIIFYEKFNSNVFLARTLSGLNPSFNYNDKYNVANSQKKNKKQKLHTFGSTGFYAFCLLHWYVKPVVSPLILNTLLTWLN